MFVYWFKVIVRVVHVHAINLAYPKVKETMVNQGSFNEVGWGDIKTTS